MAINLSKQTKNTRGFTLVELSVVLVIIGILISALMPLYKTYTEQSRKKTQEARMGTIRTALSDFIIDDPNNDSDSDEKRFPCPASPTAQIGSATYGREQCVTGGAGTCVNGVCIRAGAGGRLVMVGSVPTSTLGIASINMNDAYNNRFSYAVTMDLTQPNAMDSLTTKGAITIVNESGGQITNEAQFSLISHGADGAGSYTAAGIKNGAPCRTTHGGDAENCNDDATFRDNAGMVLANNDDFYDDSAAFTLTNDDDDEWWRETNPSGLNIVNRNTQNVGIGFPTGEPQQRLDVNGSIRSRIDAIIDRTVQAGRDVVAAVNITATSGNISATVGSVSAGNNVTAANNSTAGMDVSAGRNVNAGSDVMANRDVRGTRDVAAGNNVTAGNEVTATNNIRAGKSVYAKENFYGKHFFYSDVPSSGPGGGSGNVTVTAMCPEGQVLRGLNSNSPVCVTATNSTLANFSCASGSFVNKFDAEGRPVCTGISDPSTGLVKTFSCPMKNTTQWGEDYQTGYLNYPDNWCAYTYATVATACIEPGTPGRQTMKDNLPAPYGNIDTATWTNICGKRFCVQQGYNDGRVTEYGPSGTNPDGSYYHITEKIPGLPFETERTEVSRHMVEIKCTKI